MFEILKDAYDLRNRNANYSHPLNHRCNRKKNPQWKPHNQAHCPQAKKKTKPITSRPDLAKLPIRPVPIVPGPVPSSAASSNQPPLLAGAILITSRSRQCAAESRPHTLWTPTTAPSSSSSSASSSTPRNLKSFLPLSLAAKWKCVPGARSANWAEDQTTPEAHHHHQMPLPLGKIGACVGDLIVPLSYALAARDEKLSLVDARDRARGPHGLSARAFVNHDKDSCQAARIVQTQTYTPIEASVSLPSGFTFPFLLTRASRLSHLAPQHRPPGFSIQVIPLTMLSYLLCTGILEKLPSNSSGLTWC